MIFTKKTFNELNVKELFDIYKLRCSVFVVEQMSPYQEVDDADLAAIHICCYESDGHLAGYVRVLPPGTTFKDASIGRLIAVKRRCGIGTALMRQAIQCAKEMFGTKSITIEAQIYMASLYRKLGFHEVSEEFSDVGILHVLMRKDL